MIAISMTEEQKIKRLETIEGKKASQPVPKDGDAEAPWQASPLAAAERKALVERLANMSAIEYGQARKEYAKQFDVRVIDIDQDVQAHKRRSDDKPDNSILFPDVEPWDEPVDGAEVLDGLSSVVASYVILPDGAADVVAVWIVHTYSLDAFYVSPILAITSPEKGCGKSTLLGILNRLAYRPLTSSNISPASVFRTIEKWGPTLLIDEADSFLRRNDEHRGIMNSGHSRDSAFVIRTVGDTHEPQRFSTWGAKAVASIGAMQDTIVDRSITIPLRRKLPGEAVEQLQLGESDKVTELTRKCRRFVDDNLPEIAQARPELPAGLQNRRADNWRPFFMIAYVAGGEWPSRIIGASEKTAGPSGDDESIPTQLLSDTRDLFDEVGEDRLASSTVVDELVKLEGRPWADWNHGKGLTTNGLARLLKRFSIKPTMMRFDPSPSGSKRGYRLCQLKDAFARYLPPPTVTPLQPAPDAAFSGSSTVTGTVDVTDGNQGKPLGDKDCYGVTDETGGVAADDMITESIEI